MPRSPRGLRAALVLAGCLVLAGLACSSGTDPTSPTGAAPDNTYVKATFTLLDTAAPCRPGVACDPEFLSCDGSIGFTIPTTWAMRADIATAGAINYTAANPALNTNGRATIVVTGTDSASGTSMSVALSLTIDVGTGAVTVLPGGNPSASFANVQTSCQAINATGDPLTLFGYVTSQPFNATVTEAPVSGTDLIFASRNGADLTGGILAGTFDFVAANRQEFGTVYIGQIRVQGCFRVPITLPIQGVAVEAFPPSPACN